MKVLEVKDVRYHIRNHIGHLIIELPLLNRYLPGPGIVLINQIGDLAHQSNVRRVIGHIQTAGRGLHFLSDIP